MNDIIEHAKAQGLCNEWYEQMKAKPTLKNLCEMYFRGDDWAKEHDFPKLKDLRKYRDEIMALSKQANRNMTKRWEAAIAEKEQAERKQIAPKDS